MWRGTRQQLGCCLEPMLTGFSLTSTNFRRCVKDKIGRFPNFQKYKHLGNLQMQVSVNTDMWPYIISFKKWFVNSRKRNWFSRRGNIQPKQEKRKVVIDGGVEGHIVGCFFKTCDNVFRIPCGQTVTWAG